MSQEEINVALQRAYDTGFKHGLEDAAKTYEEVSEHTDKRTIIAAAIRARVSVPK